ncbi:hypothetical protein ACIGKQ_06935 [Gordonia sp. NPDC062954]|uniref:hypothetical protein n=1 Tax=Gordonia sp. NPDC062954 TaxID=3364003 RepID=UPI0037CBC172
MADLVPAKGVSSFKGNNVLKDVEFWAELIPAAGLGALLFWVFDLEDLGQITWIVGALLIYHRYVLRSHFRAAISPIEASLERNQESVARIGELIDISDSCNDAMLRAVVDKYVHITESELAWQKNESLIKLERELDSLLRDKRSRTMLTSEYYRWLLPRIASTSAGSNIWAVSRMMDCEWDNSPEESDFLKLNLEAAKRGVQVERIFLCERDIWERARSTLEPVRRQLSCGGNLQIYFGDVNAIQKRDAEILKLVGDGLIAFDNDVILIDDHSEDGTARGHVVMAPQLIAASKQTFESLKVMCAPQRPLSESD